MEKYFLGDQKHSYAQSAENEGLKKEKRKQEKVGLILKAKIVEQMRKVVMPNDAGIS